MGELLASIKFQCFRLKEAKLSIILRRVLLYVGYTNTIFGDFRPYLLLKELLMSVVNPIQDQMILWLVIKFVLIVQGNPILSFLKSFFCNIV